MVGTQWEYIGIEAQSNSLKLLMRRLNDAGARGWELVSISDNDKMIGLNSILAIMRRPIDPLPDPESIEADWKPDPSGRFEGRYWDGEAWTMRTMSDGVEHRDPPTLRTPASVDQ